MQCWVSTTVYNAMTECYDFAKSDCSILWSGKKSGNFKCLIKNSKFRELDGYPLFWSSDLSAVKENFWMS